MCQGTLNLLTYVLPAVPLRQSLLTLLFEVRAPLAYPGMGGLVDVIAAVGRPELRCGDVKMALEIPTRRAA